MSDSSPPLDPAQGRALIDQYLMGSIPGPDFARLEAALAANRDLREQFRLRCNLDAALCRIGRRAVHEAMELGGDTRGAGCESAPTPQTSSSLRWLLAAAACAALLAGGWMWTHSQQVFATVVEGLGVEELGDGAVLRGKTHSIRAGTAQIVSALGARIVIEAPAEFRFESAQRLHLRGGRLSADVPPAAKGFTVVTPSGDAVDLGTRFGVDVPPHGPAEIHVFKGEVIAKALGTHEKQSLRSGDAVQLSRGGSAVRELRSSAFIQREEVPELSAALASGQRSRADAALDVLRRDPALITLFDFESGSFRGKHRMVQGRWPKSRAPEFCNLGEHLSIPLPEDGEWAQLTLAAWVRLDRVGGGRIQSLLHTDGWDRKNPGQVHWSVSPYGTLWFVCLPDEPKGMTAEFSAKLPAQGRWTHLVTVYDSPHHTLRHYVNGQCERELSLMTAPTARFGPSQIGNWNLYDRNLSGRVDDMVILGRAMSDTEVRALFDSGNPYGAAP
jgi:hypothetical protein